MKNVEKNYAPCLLSFPKAHLGRPFLPAVHGYSRLMQESTSGGGGREGERGRELALLPAYAGSKNYTGGAGKLRFFIDTDGILSILSHIIYPRAHISP